MIKTFSLCIVGAAALSAQPIGFGIKGGLPLTDAFDVGSSQNIAYESKTKRWIFGPMVELRLPAGLAIEFDALYTQLEFSSVLGTAGSVVNSFTDADSWEFPLVLKKKFGGANAVAASVRPYVEVGAAFRRITDITQIREFITGSSSETNNPAELEDRNSTGFVIGGGLEIRALFLRIAPELRFIHWGKSNFRAGIADVLNTNRNQGQFLVGFYF
jgi:hypothetical protein